MVASGVSLGLVGVLLAVTFVSSSPAAPPGVKVPFHDPQVLPKPTLQPQMPGFVQQCQVKDYERVPCGEPGVQAARCNSLNCCFDGQQCYYGKTVTVQCTLDGQFVLVVARDATLPRISLSSISMLGGNAGPCSPVDSNAVFAVYQFPVTACGTIMMVQAGYVIYENMMFSSYEVGVGPRGVITRDTTYECPYTDDRYLTKLVPVNETSGLAYPTHYRRFVFKMFTFVDETAKAPLHETIYIHCSTAVCLPSAQDSCEPQCSRRRREAAAEEGSSHTSVVSSGEVIFTRYDSESMFIPMPEQNQDFVPVNQMQQMVNSDSRYGGRPHGDALRPRLMSGMVPQGQLTPGNQSQLGTQPAMSGNGGNNGNSGARGSPSPPESKSATPSPSSSVHEDDADEALYKKKTETAKKEYLKQLAAYRATLVSQSYSEPGDVKVSQASQMLGPKPPSFQSHPGLYMAPPYSQQPHLSSMQHGLARGGTSRPGSNLTMGNMAATTPPPLQISPPLHQHISLQQQMGSHSMPLHSPSMAQGFPLQAEYQSLISVSAPSMDYRTGCRSGPAQGLDWTTDYCTNGALQRDKALYLT
ncbi:thymocyte selection-associated high mobility group box protein TOX [Silurus meridionalis]|nr:thymocyte selection-associated high mobility group box protein TOX [Silurus meridionalis]